MTDLPYGRGGSPLQNLILSGNKSTKITAFKMVDELDAGPVYLKESLSLEGNAEEIYYKASYLSARMIQRIIEEQPEPKPQEGRVTTFKRRKPRESQIPPGTSLQNLYDFIRMLDAQGYPHAYLECSGFHYEFKRAQLCDDRIIAEVTIVPLKGLKDE